MNNDLKQAIADNNGYIKLKGYGVSRDVILFGNKLDLQKSLNEAEFSSDGFNWGYSGDGAKQLALALLIELIGIVPNEVQNFDNALALVTLLPQGDFEIQVNMTEWLNPVPSSLDALHIVANGTIISKRIDFPHSDLKSAMVCKGSPEFEMIDALSDMEFLQYQGYIHKTTRRKALHSDDIIHASLIKTDRGFLYTDGLGSRVKL